MNLPLGIRGEKILCSNGHDVSVMGQRPGHFAGGVSADPGHALAHMS